MNIKPFLLISILIGAAAILPIHTYAQDHRGSDHRSEKAEIHTDAKDKEMKMEKTIPDPKKQSDQGNLVKNPGPPQEMPAKAHVPKEDKRPQKAVPPGINQRAEAQKNRFVKAVAVEKETVDTRNVKKEDPIKITTPEAHSEPLTAERSRVKDSVEKLSYGVSKVVEKEIESLPEKKKITPQTPVQNPIQKPDDQSPSEKPVDIEVIHTSSNRNQPSGGKTQDLPGTGAGSANFIAGSFHWESGLYLGNIYHDSEVQYWYQWMNAPPSPPPEKSPFLTV